MQIEWVDIDKLRPNPRNPNQHSPEQIERLVKLIRYQNWRHPIIVSNQSGFIAAGHGRLEAAKKMGLKQVPVHYQDFVDSDQEYAFLVSDNSVASWAELDLGQINVDLQELDPSFDIDLLGIKDFVLEPADKYGDADEDAVPATPKIAKSKRGELWLLGEHRVLCGDATSKEDVQRLMGDEKADMVFTDPPYGIDLDTDYTKYGPGGQAHKQIEGDAKPFNPRHILEMDVDETFLFGANFFAEQLPNNNSWIVWDKRSSEENIGQLDGAYGSDVEICWSKQRHGMRICRILKQTAVFAARGDDKQLAHPTQKPIGLTEWFFERWGKEANLIWDGYLGSGSTLIACEKTSRKCYGSEIEPLYIDVILERWAKFTGKDPVREDGTKWSELQ